MSPAAATATATTAGADGAALKGGSAKGKWGKEEGPYARLRALGAREGDSRFGAAIRENSSLGSEKRVDSRGNGELHRGH